MVGEEKISDAAHPKQVAGVAVETAAGIFVFWAVVDIEKAVPRDGI